MTSIRYVLSTPFLPLCSAYSITQGIFITAPAYFLSVNTAMTADASEQSSSPSFLSQSKLADDSRPSYLSSGRLYKRYV